MQDNNRFAVTVGLAIIFLSVFFTNSIRAVPPQLESMLGSGSSGIQLAQSADPTLEPPSPVKPHATTGVTGSRPEKPPTMTGVLGKSRSLSAPRAGAAREPRIALVIGNSGYRLVPGLKNPVNDAQLIAKTLRSVGFKVIERTNADQKAMKRALQKFGDLLEEAGKEAVGLFYYAGHGVQANGRNYLIPLDAQIQRESDMEIEAVSADWVVDQMEFARNRVNFVILDACRTNPYAKSFRSATRGLARMKALPGSFIAYSTAPGDVAYDGPGVNSLYTEALAEEMQAPGVPVEQMFKRVRRSVRAATGEQQTPWEESSLSRDFYFNPVSLPPGPLVASAPGLTVPLAAKVITREPATVVASRSVEMEFWRSIKDSKNPADFEAYLKKYPDGEFTSLATNRIKQARPQVVSLAVHADKKELEVNQRIALKIKGKYSDGREVEIRQGVEWESTDERIVSVDSRGQVEAQKVGSADITARYEGLASLPLTFTVSNAIQDHLKIAKFFRERGEYSDAISELKKARSVDPENKQVLDELKKTRKACNAEKRLGRKGLEC